MMSAGGPASPAITDARVARCDVSCTENPPGTRILGAVLLAAILCACEDAPQADPLAEIRRTGEILILTRNGSTTYYEGRDGFDGYEYALTQALARTLNVKARYEVYDSIPELLDAMEQGRGHIAAAALTRTPEREQRYKFGPDYKTVQQQVVCHRRGPVPKKVDDLSEVSLLVLDGSSYDERLRELAEEIPGLAWETTAELSTDEILEKVWKREVDCAVADSNIVAINRRYFPELDIVFPITDEQHLAWVLPQGADELGRVVDEWMKSAAESDLLARLDERYYGHVTIFDYVDLKRYADRIEKRLPKYRPIFEQASAEHDIPWTLLAAVSYQESQWNPRAKSPTGVRGMMMLTKTTASAVGVTNRLDPKQSIMGGAKYLDRMMKRVPSEVQGRNRLWYALASYNIGFGHLQDARELARNLDKDPNQWFELKTVLPLLSRKKYYKTLRHGYARGTEPVRYVERIREYHDVLTFRLSEEELQAEGNSAWALSGR